MAWITVVDEEAAEGELREIYQAQGEKAGTLANILKVHSLVPRTLSTHMAFYEAVMHVPGELTRAPARNDRGRRLFTESLPLLTAPSWGRSAPVDPK